MLMLAVMLPAAALIGFGGFSLRNMQREKVIEAAYQVEYEHTLAIAEKQINERAYDMAEDARMQFPDMDSSDADRLDSFLTAHPDIAHAFLWTGKDHFIFRSQPSRMSSGAFCAEDQTLASDFADWWSMDGKTYINKLRWHEANEGTHFFFHESLAYQGRQDAVSVFGALSPPRLEPRASRPGGVYL